MIFYTIQAKVDIHPMMKRRQVKDESKRSDFKELRDEWLSRKKSLTAP